MSLNVVSKNVGTKRKVIRVENPVRLPRKTSNVHEMIKVVPTEAAHLNAMFAENTAKFDAYKKYVSKARPVDTVEGVLSLQCEIATYSAVKSAYEEYANKHKINRITNYAFVDEEEIALSTFNNLFNNIYILKYLLTIS